MVALPRERSRSQCHEARVGFGIFGWRRIVVAGSFIAQGAVDDDEIRRWSSWRDLAGGGQADQQLAAAAEQFLGDEDGERCTDGAADDADGLARKREDVEPCVVARPALEYLGF